MLLITVEGFVLDPRVILQISPAIEHGAIKAIQGIIVHQTGGASAKSSLDSYKKPNANGAHFLIDKDGTIYQTASVRKITYHVGPLKSRCELEGSCSVDEQKLNKVWNVKAQHQREMQKSVPARFPSNLDAIGIELVGEAILPNGGVKNRDETYVAATEKQNASLKWLVSGLVEALKFSRNEIFTHPTVSRKLGSEASTAKW
jgi:N-acetyl-anhydromuramyl-L-alanine amidase AmpD